MAKFVSPTLVRYLNDRDRACYYPPSISQRIHQRDELPKLPLDTALAWRDARECGDIKSKLDGDWLLVPLGEKDHVSCAI